MENLEARLRKYAPLWGHWIPEKRMYHSDSCSVFTLSSERPEQGFDCVVKVITVLGQGEQAERRLSEAKQEVAALERLRNCAQVVTVYDETVVLLSKLNTKQHIEVELNLDELDLTAAESKATYDEIKAYVLEKYGLKVSSLYISQVKRKCGLDVGKNYNLSKKADAKVPQCPSEKEAAIMEALKYFSMI